MVKIFQALISKFFTAFTQAFLNILMKEASIMVIQIVQDVNKEDISNEEKRKLAVARIKLALNNAKESSINLAVELAVKILKGERTV